MTKIPQIEPFFTAADRDAVRAIMDSGFITEGRKTREFEGEVAAYLGVLHAHAVNNATLALTIALQALGVGPGDEVIVPDFTFIATANAVSLAGATPVFADVTPGAFVLDLADAARRVTPRTRAIIPVHLNGRAPDMLALLELARAHRLAVIEDASQALSSMHGRRHLGTFGDAGVFSLGTTKIITSGQGGLLVTSRRDVSEAARRIKDHGRLSRSAETHDTLGFNSKFTDLQAALALSQFRALPERVAKKREIFAFYRDRLAGLPGISVPPMDLSESVPWFADILCEDRAALETRLSAAGIETRHFYLPIHSQPCYATGLTASWHAPAGQNQAATAGAPASTHLRAAANGEVRAASVRNPGDGFASVPGAASAALAVECPGTAFAARCGLWLPSSVSLTAAELGRICAEIEAACGPAMSGETRPASAEALTTH